MIIKNAFNDVLSVPMPVKSGIAGSPYLDNLLALQIGHGDVTMKSNKQGLWLGAKNFNNAPFYVDMDGNVVASSIDLVGAYVAAGGAAADVNANATLVSGAKLVSLSITSTQIANDSISTPKLQANAVEANNIATNAVTAVKINAGAVTASKISVSTLSAITADMGSLTAGTITGATIRTAVTGARFEISGSKAGSYNSGNTELTRLDGSGLGIFGTAGNTVYFKDSASGTTYGTMSYNSSIPAMYLISNNTHMVVANLSGSHDLFLDSLKDTAVGAVDDIYLLAGSGNATFVNETLRVKAINLNYNQNEGNISNVDTITGYNDINFKLGGNNDFFFMDSGGNVNARINYTGKIFSDDTNIQLNGVDKSAIMQTSRGFNALYCIESPEVWFMDFIPVGQDEDPLFDEVTTGQRMYVNVVDDKGKEFIQVWRRRRGHSKKRFEAKTPEQFNKNEQFLRMAK